jgi:hypothetical protein
MRGLKMSSLNDCVKFQSLKRQIVAALEKSADPFEQVSAIDHVVEKLLTTRAAATATLFSARRVSVLLANMYDGKIPLKDFLKMPDVLEFLTLIQGEIQ